MIVEVRKQTIVSDGNVSTVANPLNNVCPYRAICEMIAGIEVRRGNAAARAMAVKEECEGIHQPCPKIVDIEDILASASIGNGDNGNGTTNKKKVFRFKIKNKSS